MRERVKIFVSAGLQRLRRALQLAIQNIVPEFEKATGHKVKIVYGSIGVNAPRVRNGEEADRSYFSSFFSG